VREIFDEVALRSGGRRPSVESLLHAVCLSEHGVEVVAHTHPVDVNAILCSTRPSLLVEGSLFPDQIVVLGREPWLIPYVDPGLQLAREVRRRLREHRGAPPRAIYLQNHGLFALGRTARDAESITEMAVKVARILRGASEIGGARFMDEHDVLRIDTRPDEVLRRDMLSGRSSEAQQ
jgi:rhamnose utilization protein RhaD (predicted bifunctional aldolase and dehydrogenase)